MPNAAVRYRAISRSPALPQVDEVRELARRDEHLRQELKTPDAESLLFPRISPQKTRTTHKKKRTKQDYISDIPKAAPIARRREGPFSQSPEVKAGTRLYTPSGVVRGPAEVDAGLVSAEDVGSLSASPWGASSTSFVRGAAKYEVSSAALSPYPAYFSAHKYPKSVRRRGSRLQPLTPSFATPSSRGYPDDVSTVASRMGGATSRSSMSRMTVETSLPDLRTGGFVDKAVALLLTMKTGDDAIAYFARYGEEARTKFIYLVRQDPKDPAAAYELVVVPPEAITGVIHAAGPQADGIQMAEGHPKGVFGTLSTSGPRVGYYTMSASGVVSVSPGEPSEVVSMEEWIREKSSFTFLRRIRFFKFFRLLKFFRGWWKYARRVVFKHAKAHLKGKLLLLRPRFAARIVQARTAACGFQTAALMRPIVELLRQRPIGVEEFREKADAAAKVAGTVLNHYMEKIQSILSDTWIDILRAQQQNAPIAGKGGADAKHSNGPTKRFDSLAKAATLSKHTGGSVTALAREMVEKEAQAIAMWEEAVKDRESFPYFIRLLDAMVVESLLEWAAEECKEYADVLWRGSSDDTEGGIRVLRGLFLCSVHLSGLSDGDNESSGAEFADAEAGSIVISPSTGALQLAAVEDVIERLRTTVESVPRLLFMPPCLKFFARPPQSPPLRAMLAAHEPLTRALDLAAEAVERDFTRMAEIERYLEPYMRIVSNFAHWNAEDYRGEKLDGATVDPEKGLMPIFHSIGSDLNRLRHDLSLVERLRVSTPLGCLHVEARALKTALSARLSTIMDKVKHLLLELSSRECNEASATTRAISEALAKKAAARSHDAFGFLEQMREADSVNRMMVLKSRAIDFGFHLMENFHVKIPTQDKVHHDTLHESLERISERLEMCERWLDTQRAQLSKTIDAQLNTCAEDALLYTAEAASLDSPSLEVEEALGRFESLAEKATSLRAAMETGVSRKKLLGGARSGGAAEENVRGLEAQVEAGKTRWALFSAAMDARAELAKKTIREAARIGTTDEFGERVEELELLLPENDGAAVATKTKEELQDMKTVLRYLSVLPSQDEVEVRETELAKVIVAGEGDKKEDESVSVLFDNVMALGPLADKMAEEGERSQ